MQNKKRTAVFAIVFGPLLLSYGWFSGSSVPSVPSHDSVQQEQGRVIPNKAFSVGEKLTFDIDWGPITVGTAEMAIPRIKKYNGHTVYDVRSTVYSNKMVAKIYPVEDRFISYIDSAGIYSHRFEKHQREGNWKRDRIFFLDQVNNLGISRQDTIEIPRFTQDIISAFYYVRTLDLKVGDVIDIPNYDNGKVHDIEVEVQKKIRIRVPAGKFDCLLIEPKLKTQALFKNEGRIFIYVTDDERKIPVLMVSKVIFGQISAKLTKIEKEILP